MTTTATERLTLRQAIARFRRELEQRRRSTTRELLESYAVVNRRLQAEMGVVTAKIAAARAAGEEISISWLAQQGRLEDLQRQVALEVRRWSQDASRITLEAQRDLLALGGAHAKGLTAAAMGDIGIAGSWSTLPEGATLAMAGFSSDGSPLRELFDGLGDEAGLRVRQTMVQAVVMGWNPVKTARELRRVSALPASRAVLIARTEQLRAYREASRRSYEANSSLVTGWVWWSATSPSTCAACWAMHGTKHKVGETLDGHPACKCTMVPDTMSRAGRRVVEETGGTGVDRFAQLDSAVQRRILGPAKYEAFRSGEISLQDLVHRRRSARWGTSRQEASLRQIRRRRARERGAA